MMNHQRKKRTITWKAIKRRLAAQENDINRQLRLNQDESTHRVDDDGNRKRTARGNLLIDRQDIQEQRVKLARDFGR